MYKILHTSFNIFSCLLSLLICVTFLVCRHSFLSSLSKSRLCQNLTLRITVSFYWLFFCSIFCSVQYHAFYNWCIYLFSLSILIYSPTRLNSESLLPIFFYLPCTFILHSCSSFLLNNTPTYQFYSIHLNAVLSKVKSFAILIYKIFWEFVTSIVTTAMPECSVNPWPYNVNISRPRPPLLGYRHKVKSLSSTTVTPSVALPYPFCETFVEGKLLTELLTYVIVANVKTFS